MKKILFLFFIIYSANVFAQSGWQVLQTPSKAQLNGLFFLTENEGYVVGDSNTIFHTTDGGESWITIPHPLSEINHVFLGDITVYNDSIIIVGGGVIDSNSKNGKNGLSLVMRSHNKGQNWTVDTSLGGTATKGRIFTLVKTPWSLYAQKWDGGGPSRLRSDDTGRTWKIGEGDVWQFGGAFKDTNIAMFTGAFSEPFLCRVNITTDRGQTWASIYPDGNNGVGNPFSTAKYSCVAHVKAKRWVIGSEVGIWLTEDDGANWTGLEKTTTKNFNAFSMTFADTAIGFGSIGNWYFVYKHDPIKQAIIQKTTDGGLSWAPLYTPSGVGFVNRMQALSPSLVYAVADSGIVLKTTNGGGDFVFSSVPNTYIEQQDITITPNPSHGDVTIQILQPAKAGKLEICDVLGRIVKDIDLSNDTKNIPISGLSPGIYYCRWGLTIRKFLVY